VDRLSGVGLRGGAKRKPLVLLSVSLKLGFKDLTLGPQPFFLLHLAPTSIPRPLPRKLPTKQPLHFFTEALHGIALPHRLELRHRGLAPEIGPRHLGARLVELGVLVLLQGLIIMARKVELVHNLAFDAVAFGFSRDWSLNVLLQYLILELDFFSRFSRLPAGTRVAFRQPPLAPAAHALVRARARLSLDVGSYHLTRFLHGSQTVINCGVITLVLKLTT
jgi:hypothetical protein